MLNTMFKNMVVSEINIKALVVVFIISLCGSGSAFADAPMCKISNSVSINSGSVSKVKVQLSSLLKAKKDLEDVRNELKEASDREEIYAWLTNFAALTKFLANLANTYYGAQAPALALANNAMFALTEIATTAINQKKQDEQLKKSLSTVAKLNLAAFKKVLTNTSIKTVLDFVSTAIDAKKFLDTVTYPELKSQVAGYDKMLAEYQKTIDKYIAELIAYEAFVNSSINSTINNMNSSFEKAVSDYNKNCKPSNVSTKFYSLKVTAKLATVNVDYGVGKTICYNKTCSLNLKENTNVRLSVTPDKGKKLSSSSCSSGCSILMNENKSFNIEAK